MAFIFEGEFDFRAIGIDFAVADNHVLFHDFGYAQLAQMFSSLLDRILGSIFPTLGAGAYEFDNVVRALWTTLWVLWAIAHSPWTWRGSFYAECGNNGMHRMPFSALHYSHGRRRFPEATR